MATSSPLLAQRLLRKLADQPVIAALLHGDELIAEGRAASDLDLACSGRISDVLAVLDTVAEGLGLQTVLIWVYDVNSYTVLVVDLVAEPRSAAVQVDLLLDPDGHGKYRIRTDVLLASRVDGRSFPRASAIDETLYVWRKAIVKGQGDRQAEALRRLRTWPTQAVRSRAAELLALPSSSRWLGERARGSASRWVNIFRRARFRIEVPLGSVVELPQNDLTRELLSELRAIIPTVDVVHRRTGLKTWLIRRRRALVLIPAASPPLGRNAALARIQLQMHQHSRGVLHRLSSGHTGATQPTGSTWRGM